MTATFSLPFKTFSATPSKNLFLLACPFKQPEKATVNMAEFGPFLQRYNLKQSHAADSGNGCITINVNSAEGMLDNAFEYVSEQVQELFHKDAGRIHLATKLYVVGEWRLCFPPDTGHTVMAVAKIADLIQEMTNLEELTQVDHYAYQALPY